MEELASVGLALAICFVALALLVRRPRHPVSLLLGVMALASVLQFTALGSTFGNTLWGLSVLPLSMLLVAFPDGPRGPRWRAVFTFQIVTLTLAVAAAAVWPEDSTPQVVTIVLSGAAASFVPIAAAAVVSLVRLWRRSVGGRRLRIGVVLAAGAWLVLFYVVLVPTIAALDALGLDVSNLQAAPVGLTFAALPVAIAVAALMEPGGRRYPVVEVMWRVGLLGAGALVVGGSTFQVLDAFSVSGPTLWAVVLIVTALAVAVGVTWAGRAGELVPASGERTRAGLADLASRLSAAPAPEQVPALVARTLGEALELRGAAVVMSLADGDEQLATWGSLGGDRARQVTRPLTHAGAVVGRIVLAPHPDGVPIDLAALDALAHPVATTVAAERLTRDLERARDRVLQVRDEERARLRADLHDELSPSLAGTRLALAAARDRLGPGRDSPAEGLLAQADGELVRASGVVRGILEDLRPDSLTRLGLVAALRERAAAFDRPGVFTVTVHAEEPLPGVGPAVETAVLRIAGEAVANAARHSHGSQAGVSLAADADGLLLAVTDDGIGIPALPREGVGLGSMQRRAAAVRGHLEILKADGGGTLVRGWFPASADTRNPDGQGEM